MAWGVTTAATTRMKAGDAPRATRSAITFATVPPAPGVRGLKTGLQWGLEGSLAWTERRVTLAWGAQLPHRLVKLHLT